MGLFSGLFGGEKAEPVARNHYPDLGGGTELFAPYLSGATSNYVTPQAAMQHSAVFGCVRVISQVIGSLHIDIVNDETGAIDRGHPLKHVLDTKPNNLVTARDMWEQALIDQLLTGRGFVRIIRDRRTGLAKSLVRCEDFHVRVKITKSIDPKLIYLVTNPWGGTDVVDQADMLHFRNFGSSNLLGETAIEIAGGSITAANTEEQFSHKYFASSGHLKDVVEFPMDADAEQVKEFKRNFKVDHSGKNAFDQVGVILNGGKHRRLSLSAQDAQTLEARKFSVEQICRIFGVPMVMIGSLDKQTSFGKGVGEQFKFFINLTLNPILQKMECEMKIKLFYADDNLEMRFNREGLTKGDLEATTKADTAAVGGNQIPGTLTQNEVRKRKGYPPIDDPKADKLYQPIDKIGRVDNNLKPTSDEGDDDEQEDDEAA
ncbi:MAG: phage portal protein [Alphaproteobacteria bacterium]|nr:phage portal protein [Alphaproteobacteria bacterium]